VNLVWDLTLERLTIGRALVLRQEGGIFMKINGKMGVRLQAKMLKKISVIGEF
jgi:hypothetical protein